MRRSHEEINRKCLILQDLGFTINHEDSNVTYLGVTFDFSATACDVKSIMYTAMRHMHEQAFASGKAQVQQDIKQALGIEE